MNETLKIPIRDVYVLIEMPLFGVDPAYLDRVLRIWGGVGLGDDIAGAVGTSFIMAVRTFEPAYLALSHPVFGLASNFAEIEKWVAYRLALYYVRYDTRYRGSLKMLDTSRGTL